MTEDAKTCDDGAIIMTPLVAELLTLLDLIEHNQDPALEVHRFDIAKKHGLTIRMLSTKTSSKLN